MTITVVVTDELGGTPLSVTVSEVPVEEVVLPGMSTPGLLPVLNAVAKRALAY